jgi:hypothetical protein
MNLRTAPNTRIDMKLPTTSNKRNAINLTSRTALHIRNHLGKEKKPPWKRKETKKQRYDVRTTHPEIQEPLCAEQPLSEIKNRFEPRKKSTLRA